LEKYIGGYDKNDPEIYERVKQKGNEERAIMYARKLYEQYDHTNPAIENPSTTIFFLVNELLMKIK